MTRGTNGDSGRRWATDADRRDRVVDSVAEALLVSAHLAADEAVLDVCGCGATDPGSRPDRGSRTAQFSATAITLVGVTS
jgi:hypothetical protein